MKKLTKSPRRLLVTSPRNSVCGSARLADLDWSEWWTDNWGVPGVLYLFVAGPDGSAHRVYCKHTETPRLAMRGGKLYWLVKRD